MKLFNFKKQKPAPKKENKEFVDYAESAKLKEFQRYLNKVSTYFNNPLSELLKQRGMLLETLYIHKISKEDKVLIRLEIEKIDKMIDKLIKTN